MSFQRAVRSPWPAALTPLAFGLAAALGSAAASAQSLTAIYEAARGFDPTYLGARALADSAEYRVEQSRALHRPSVGLSVSGIHADANTPGSSPTKSLTNTLDAKLSAQQQIFNRSNDLLVDQAEKSLEVSKAALQLAEQDLIVRVAQAYFDVLASAEALKSVQANEKGISEQLASAKRNFEVGNATITDTREAEARADLARAQEIAAQNDLEVKKVALDQLVGRVGVVPQPLAAPVVLPPVLPGAAADWVRLAEADSPSLKQALVAYDVAKLETARARAGNLPTVAVGASYDKSHTNGDFTVPQIGSFSQSSNAGNAQVAVTLNLPLFAGYAIQNREKETVALEDKARNDFEAARSGVTVGTRTAFLGAQSGSAQVKALEAAEVSSKLALDATQLGYKVGVKVNIDVLNAQTQLFQTQRDLAKARYDYLLATLKLRQAAGQLKADDLLAINALLSK